jgi:hypothetical protein
MKPTSPVIPGNENFETVYAENQSAYMPLPTLRNEKVAMSRWELTPEERQYLIAGGNLYIVQLHGGELLQPILLPFTSKADDALKTFIELTETYS